MASQKPSAAAHVVDLLESYLLGDLSTAEEAALEAHLLECDNCRDECDRLGELGLMVATLPAATVRELERIGLPPKRQPVRGGAQRITQPGRSWNARTLVAAAAALVLGVALGGVGWAFIGPHQATGVPVGNESVNSLAGRLSVTANDRVGGGTDLQAVVVGLQPGVDFELIAVGTDQHVYSVTRGRAGGGPQQVMGSVPVPIGRILLFAVISDSHTVVALTLP